jgi:hypothetical protein
LRAKRRKQFLINTFKHNLPHASTGISGITGKVELPSWRESLQNQKEDKPYQF